MGIVFGLGEKDVKTLWLCSVFLPVGMGALWSYGADNPYLCYSETSLSHCLTK